MKRQKLSVIKAMSGMKLASWASAILIILFLVPHAAVGARKAHPYRYSDVDIPVSLEVATVKTPEFPAAGQWYDIVIQVEKPLPFNQMRCMMGVTSGPLDSQACSRNDPLLQADWTVREGENIVDHGSIPGRCSCEFTDKYIFKFLGSFFGDVGKKYVVEVKFTKDGTPLKLANPHLIVIEHNKH